MPKISADAFRILLETVPDGFFVHDGSGRLLDVNAQSCANLGYSRDELLERNINDVSCGAGPEENARKWTDTPVGAAMSFQERAVRKDGSTFPVEISLTCQLIEGQKLFFGLAHDVSDRETAREAVMRANSDLECRVEAQTAELRYTHERMMMAARVGGFGIWDYDLARDDLDCDAHWYRIMGRDPLAPIRRIAGFREIVHPDDVELAGEVEETAARLVAENEDYEVVYRILRPDGEMRWIRSAACIVVDAEGKPARALGFVEDITESWLAEESLQRQTLEDPLTGLANRRRLDEELAKACLHATRTGEAVTMVMIDVDHFKLYNDEQGHVRGDSALEAVAGILTGIARRPYDLAARYGGEEFILLLPGIDEPGAILRRIRDDLAALQIPHPTSPVAPYLTVSCGAVVVSELADFVPLDLLAACDQALYRAKGKGRNSSHIDHL